MEIDKDRLMAMMTRLMGLKPVNDHPTFDDVANANPDLATEFGLFREVYDKYAEWTSALVVGDPYNCALVAGILAVNKLITHAYSAIVDGKVLPVRWRSVAVISEDDVKYLEEKKADIVSFMRRADQTEGLLPLTELVPRD